MNDVSYRRTMFAVGAILILVLAAGMFLLPGCVREKAKTPETSSAPEEKAAVSPADEETSTPAAETGMLTGVSRKLACEKSLQQLRRIIDAKKAAGEPLPTDLKAIARELEVPPDFLLCPEAGKPYQYDPATGKVWCFQPGHEDN